MWEERQLQNRVEHTNWNNNVPGLKCHSWCSEDDAGATSDASTATGRSLRAGTAMTAGTHLVTCRQKHGPLQAYLEKTQPDVNARLLTEDADSSFMGVWTHADVHRNHNPTLHGLSDGYCSEKWSSDKRSFIPAAASCDCFLDFFFFFRI